MSCPRCGDDAVSDAGAFCQSCGGPTVESEPSDERARNAGGRTAAGRADGELSVEEDGGAACASCGSRQPPGANFCRLCGTALRVVGAAPPLRDRLEQPRLVAVLRDGTDGASYPVTSEQFDIGRSEADLLFEDPHMAARHARISSVDGNFVLAPLEARNGVYVQIQRPVEILDGDHLLLGKQVLRFEIPLEVEVTMRPAIEHGVVLFGTPVKVPWARLRQVTAAGTTRDVFHLTRPDIVLGREQGDIVFSDDEFLSRRHAQVQNRGGRVMVQDLGSSNGTFLRLRGEHTLRPGELIRMGDELLRFEIG
jgi:pSer/pThr/pTyr-binding forkhead associated (FHA) protein